MSKHKLTVETREITGKGAARQNRMIGKTPGICYGKSFEPVKVLVDTKEANYLINHGVRIVDLTIGKDSKVALVKEIQSEPLSGKLVHIDFQIVEENEVFKTFVPVQLLNVQKSHGVRMGGQLVQHVYKLNVRTDLKHLPAAIEVDVLELSNTQSKLVRHLNIEGVEILSPASVAICSISKARSKA